MSTRTLAAVIADVNYPGPGVTGLVDLNGQPMDLSGNADSIVLLTSGVVTANGVSSDMSNLRCRGVKLYITTGTFGASESVMTVSIQGKDPISGAYYTILTSAALVASKDPSNSPILTIYPGLVAAANVTVSDVLPKSWRVTYQATAWGTGGSTLGISAALIV